MKVIKVFIALLACIFICNSLLLADDKNEDIQIIYTSEKLNIGSDAFRGYNIKNNELYINVSIDTGQPDTEPHIFKFSNGKLVDMNLSEEEAEKYYEEAKPMYDFDSNDNRIIIDENRYIKLGPEGNPRIWLVDGKKESALQGFVFLTPRLTYMYLDKENEKLYFGGSGFKKVAKEYEEMSGILIYDIKTGDIKKFALSEDAPKVENQSWNNIRDIESFYNPIRVPNTPYLLFFMQKRVDNKYFYQIAIKEIPEWKAEIEAKEKAGNKSTEEVKAADNKSADIKERYVVDGPANIRDNYKKGKTIATIENDEEITIVDKKGSWYQISYKDITGWTFKDNIKKVN